MSNVAVTKQVEQNRTAAAGYRDRPTTVVWSSCTGWLLLACFFLPLAEGCNNEIISPSNVLLAPRTHLTDYLTLGAWIGLYANGAIWSVVIWGTAVSRSRQLFFTALHLQLILTAIVLLVWLITAVLESSFRESVEAAASLAPIPILILLAVGKSVTNRDWIRAWARLQLLWLLAYAALTHLQIVLTRAVLWGYFVAMFAVVIHFRSIHVVQNRIESELWDESQPVAKFRFSIRQTLIWTTILAALIAYYQNLHYLLEWLFDAS